MKRTPPRYLKFLGCAQLGGFWVSRSRVRKNAPAADEGKYYQLLSVVIRFNPILVDVDLMRSWQRLVVD